MGRAQGSSAAAATVTGDFAAVFGGRRGTGDERLDAAVLSPAARARRDQALHLARSGNFTEVADLLTRHRRNLDHPVVADLLTRSVAIACERENAARGEWLSDLVHGTLRDGRDGRILREQVQMGSRHQPSVFVVHLSPDATVDEIPFRSKRAPVCGATGNLQRAPVGAWENATGEGRTEYRRCATCAAAAERVPETADPHAALLPAENLAQLSDTLRGEVEQGIRRALKTGRALKGERFGYLAAKQYVPAAVGTAAAYAVSGGDERLDQFCSFWEINAGSDARVAGHTGDIVDLLDADWFEKALRARVPKRDPQPGPFAQRQQRTVAEAQSGRRKLFSTAVLSELERRARALRSGS